MNEKAPSALSRLLSRLAPVEPREAPAVVAAFCLFFFVLGGYFAVRPVRETVGTLLGRERVADLWVVTWIASLAIVPLYGWIVGKFRRAAFLPWIYGMVATVLALIGIAMGSGAFSTALGQFFYVFISVLNLFLMSVFWSFLLEIFDSGQTKRLFGVIAAGGSAGALTGPLVSDLTVSFIGNNGILFIGAAMFVAAIVCQRTLLLIWSDSAATQAATHGVNPGAVKIRDDKPIGGNIFAGFGIVLRSPYLLGIALFVVLLATVSTFLYFEQLRLVQEAFPDTTDRTRVFARLDWIVQSLTILSQVFLTGRIAQRFGVIALLTVVPIIMVFGFLGLAMSGTFVVLAIVFVARRFCEYAFIRPGREMLFAPLDKETKYKAKNLIDVPVYRGADALSAQVSAGITAAGFGAAVVALFGAVAAAVWGLTGWWLGRRYEANAVAAEAKAKQAG